MEKKHSLLKVCIVLLLCGAVVLGYMQGLFNGLIADITGNNQAGDSNNTANSDSTNNPDDSNGGNEGNDNNGETPDESINTDTTNRIEGF